MNRLPLIKIAATTLIMARAEGNPAAHSPECSSSSSDATRRLPASPGASRAESGSSGQIQGQPARS